MTTTVNAATNGRPRRSLNDAIGRLDEMIDGLSTAIPETIRDTLQEAVSAAVGEGVRTALVEIFSNPDILEVLRSKLMPQPPVAMPVAAVAVPAPLGVLANIAMVGTAARRWCGDKLSAAANAVAACSRQCQNKLAALHQRLRHYPVRKPLLLALAVGGLAALIALVAPHWVAATLSGLGGASVTLFVQVGLWLRQRFGGLVAATE
jgi:hypothetical protein